MSIVIAESYRPVENFLKTIPSLFEKGAGQLIYKKRNEVRRFEHKGLVFIAKRYKRVNFIQQVVYTFFRRTKAERAFFFAEEFRRRGINTPREVAYIEQKEFGLFTTGFFISEESRGRESHLELREVQDFDHELAEALVRYLVFMHSQGVLHGDPNLSNFLYERQDDGKFTFTVIDINRSRFTDGWPTDEECLHNLVRLTHRRDLYRFLVGHYAELRAWNVEETIEEAESQLDQFEHRRIRF
ncbi:MAG: lipopolysaccharide kinase InaA family protein [Prevotella sp.]|nr:lipopolysaccharide kinase InaA family protein [Prevotella sp.]